jgi:hypothetical protein
MGPRLKPQKTQCHRRSYDGNHLPVATRPGPPWTVQIASTLSKNPPLQMTWPFRDLPGDCSEKEVSILRQRRIPSQAICARTASA